MKKVLYINKLFNMRNLRMEGTVIGRKAQMLLLAGIIIAVTIASMGIIVGSLSEAKITGMISKPNPIYSEFRSFRHSFKALFGYSWAQTEYDIDKIHSAFNYAKNALNSIELRYGIQIDAELISFEIIGDTAYVSMNLTLNTLDGSIYETATESLYIGGVI